MNNLKILLFKIIKKNLIFIKKQKNIFLINLKIKIKYKKLIKMKIKNKKIKQIPKIFINKTKAKIFNIFKK